MQATKVEKLFQLLDQSNTTLKEEFNYSYLEALIDSTEQFFQEDFVYDYQNDLTKQKLKKLMQEYKQSHWSSEDKRRAFQLAALTGLKEHTGAGAIVTPDAIVMFVAYLAQKLTKQPKVICDPACGIGNLLTGVLNTYSHQGQSIYAIEASPLLIRLAYVNANLQEHEVEFIHQDALKPVLIPPVDLVVTDLPVGVYSDKEVAQSYKLYNSESEQLIQHLFLEQILQLTAPGGYIISLIPNSLFTESGSERLKAAIQEQAYVQAVLQLPQNMFQQNSIQKSVFILQKKGEHIEKPKQTLLAALPSFSDKRKMEETFQQIDQWIEKVKG